MPSVDRRTVLGAIALGVLGAAAMPVAGAKPTSKSVEPDGLLTRIPTDGRQFAFTVDDGTSSEVVAAFAQFCRDTGTRLTFFVNGANASWTENARVLRPMVDSGQIQMGNHTWSHPYITTLPDAEVADQIQRNADFLQRTYGVDGRPFFRPPFGRHSLSNDRIATDLGYRTITMWSEAVGDHEPIDEPTLMAGAARAFQPGNIALAHANLPTITRCYTELVDLIRSRNLTTVTLDDVFS